MALINWNDSHSVNVAEIDKQHKRLAAMINEMVEAKAGGDGKDALKEILINLIDYAATHFRTEERYFLQFGYPETESHKNEHASFIRKCALFIEEFEKGRVELNTDVVTYLSKWWDAHVLGTDKKYTQCFNENGLR